MSEHVVVVVRVASVIDGFGATHSFPAASVLRIRSIVPDETIIQFIAGDELRVGLSQAEVTRLIWPDKPAVARHEPGEQCLEFSTRLRHGSVALNTRHIESVHRRVQDLRSDGVKTEYTVIKTASGAEYNVDDAYWDVVTEVFAEVKQVCAAPSALRELLTEVLDAQSFENMDDTARDIYGRVRDILDDYDEEDT